MTPLSTCASRSRWKGAQLCCTAEPFELQPPFSAPIRPVGHACWALSHGFASRLIHRADKTKVPFQLAMAQPGFIISLDFEQHWGVYDHSTEEEYGTRLDGGRRAVPLMLERFERANVHATWATVGLLMCAGREDAKRRLAKLPHYPAVKHYISDVLESAGNSEQEDPRHFGQGLVKKILSAEGQEVATHTFSHFYCLEDGPSVEDFEADLVAARAVAEDLGTNLRSIVFPRNQYSDAHLEVCKRQGITAFRGNPSADPYLPRNAADTSLLTRGKRLLDAYFEVVPSEALLCRPTQERGMVNVPASRMLRPIKSFDRALTRVRLMRILKEMTLAAESGASYHLWWHPHNFAFDTDKHLELLDAILTHYHVLENRYGMQSQTMAEAAGVLL